MAISIRDITEVNFMDAFHLKLKKDQEEFVSTLSAVLHRLMSIATSVSHLEFIRMTRW